MLPVRFTIRHMAGLVAFAGLAFALLRSLILFDPFGILLWPVVLGFASDRALGGNGVAGGTIGGALGFEVAAGAATVLGIATQVTLLIALAAGSCWGFYLSIWIYMVVETILQMV